MNLLKEALIYRNIQLFCGGQGYYLYQGKLRKGKR